MNKSFAHQAASVQSRARPDRSGENASSDTIDLGAILGILWRGKLIILAMCVASLLAGIYYAYFSATPLYRSSAVVMLNNREEQVVNLESVVGGLTADASVVNTEVEVLRSRTLMNKIVDDLDLTSDPEFNRFIRPDTFTDNVKSWLKAILPLPATAPQRELSAERDAQRQQAATVDGLLSQLSIRNVPQSLVFQVTIETTDPEKSARIADTLVDLYILNQIEVKFAATEQATEWLTNRVTELQDELEQAEAEVTDFRASIDLIDSETLAAQERQLKDLRERVTGTQARVATSEARLEELRAAETRAAQAEISGDAQLARLLPRTDDPDIAETFDNRYQQLIGQVEVELQRSNTQLSALRTSAAELETQIERQSSDLITLQQLSREAEASRLLYEHFLSRLKETSAQQGVQQADSRVLSNSVVPSSASAPKKPMILGMSGMLGLLFGVGLVLVREARNDSFRDARGLEEFSGYTVMGQLPLIPVRTRRDTLTYLVEKPISAAAEAVRNLRTSVLLSNIDKTPQVIMTNSAIPGEGKTTVALALAQNFSGLGKKVLLIEGDIRRRVFTQYISAENQNHEGLISVLTGEQTLPQTVITEHGLGFDILTSGEHSQVNAADLFSSERFAELLREARTLYDHIVIDTAPVLVVPDARIIAQQVDALLFVIQWDSTSRQQVLEALQMFESINVPPSGLVLNQINPRGMKRYGYGGKYGAYSTYGRRYYQN